MEQMVFAVLAYPGQTDAEVLLLARSLRARGGVLSTSSIWVVYPQTERTFSSHVDAQLNALDVGRVPVEFDPAAPRFPFAFKVRAAGIVEALAKNQVEQLVLFDPDTLVVGDVDPLRLPAGKNLGYRPVHHTLIGSIYDRPIDAYWQHIYRCCDVPAERLFPMDTCVRDHVIRPYFNAGSLVVRPEFGVWGMWSENFFRVFQTDAFKNFYGQDQRYAIFTHQTILTGTVLAALPPNELLELSPRVNYPLHLHDDLPTQDRAESLNDLVTCRYEELTILNAWRQAHAVREPLASFLDMQLAELSVLTNA